MQIKFFLISVLLITAILGFGIGIKAKTPDIQTLILQIKAQIAQLQAQLQNMLAQQQGGQPWCHTFNKNLRFGDKGCPSIEAGGGWAGCNYEGRAEEIESLHKVLEKEGFGSSLNEDKFNGKFGGVTASAVTGFQEKYASEILTPYNLKRGTGFVGSSTRAKLNSLYGCKTYCAQDAKQCPDGSYVGRTGPNCEFAQCPVNNNNCPTVNCFWDPCPGNHLPDANGCVNCSTACSQ
ncbi:MAG: peptidoglycan-binding protein [Patescibacteria group bacterium]